MNGWVKFCLIWAGGAMVTMTWLTITMRLPKGKELRARHEAAADVFGWVPLIVCNVIAWPAIVTLITVFGLPEEEDP